MDCGIYTIVNNKSGKLYVGYSRRIKKRLEKHRSELRNKKHSNKHLQNAWDLDGESNFEFDILLECEERFLASEEHYWVTVLNARNRDFGYNKRITNPNSTSYRHDEIRIEKLKIIANRKLPNKKGPKVGSKRTLGIVPILQYDKRGNFIREWKSATEAAEYLGYTHTSGIRCSCKNPGSSNLEFFWLYKTGDDISKSLEIKEGYRGRKIVGFFKNDIIKEYNNAREASEDSGVCINRIWMCLNNVLESCKDTRWKYKNI